MLVRSATQVDAEALAAAGTSRSSPGPASAWTTSTSAPPPRPASWSSTRRPPTSSPPPSWPSALLLATARNIPPANAALKAGSGSAASTPAWSWTRRSSASSASAASGRSSPSGCAPFGMGLVAYDPYVQPARAAQLGVRCVSLDELLARVRLHHRPPAQDARDRRAHRRGGAAQGQADASGSSTRPAAASSTRHALAVAIKEGRVAGAGIDVFATEPTTESPLFEFD